MEQGCGGAGGQTWSERIPSELAFSIPDAMTYACRDLQIGPGSNSWIDSTLKPMFVGVEISKPMLQAFEYFVPFLKDSWLDKLMLINCSWEILDVFVIELPEV